MKIFITGINGFIGGTLANHFIKKGFEVYGLGRQSKLASFVNQNCIYLKGDITTVKQIPETDVFIHSAARAGDNARYDEFYRNNVEGTKNILSMCRTVKCFIYISTSSVYNFSSASRKEIEGGNMPNRLSSYGKTKYLAEEIVRNYQNIQSKYILRPRAVYGINDRLILPRLLKLIKGHKLILPSHVSKNISLTHIDNFVQAIDLCVEKQDKGTFTYNVADDKIYNLGDAITNLLSSVTENNLIPLKLPAPLWDSLIFANKIFKFNPNLSSFASKQLTQTALLDISLIKQELNYQPKRTLDNSYREIGNWVHNYGGWKKYLKDHQYIAIR